MKNEITTKKKWHKPEVQVLNVNSQTSSAMKKKAVEMMNKTGKLQPS